MNPSTLTAEQARQARAIGWLLHLRGWRLRPVLALLSGAMARDLAAHRAELAGGVQ